MQFEHLIEVNETLDKTQPVLNREDLWFGLLCRIENPVAFLPGLESSRIFERRDNFVSQELDFGAVVVRHRIFLHPFESVCFEADATDNHAGGRFIVSIVDDAERLFLRFCYETGLDEDEGKEVNLSEVVRSAWYQSDLDMVRVIREIARSGRLN